MCDYWENFVKGEHRGEFDIESRTVGLFDVIKNNPPLFASDIRYRIPIYQRPYSWGEKEILRLFQELYCGIQSGDPLFLGTIQLSAPMVMSADKKQVRYDIIDGQQRLTTIWIIIHILGLLKNEKLNNSINPKTLRTLVNNGAAQDEMNEFLLKATAINNIRSWEDGNNIYLKNAKYILQELENLLTREENETAFDCQKLISFLKDCIRIIVIETHAGLSKTLQIFDTINTTGLDLNGADIFKIRFFEYLTSVHKCLDSVFEDIVQLYKIIEDQNKMREKNVSSMKEILSILQAIIISKYDFNKVLFDYSSNRFFELLFDALLNIQYAENFQKKNIESIINDKTSSPLSINEIRKIIECRYEIEDIYNGANSVLKKSFLWHMIGRTRYSRYWYLSVIHLYQFGKDYLQDFFAEFVKVSICYSMRYGKSVNEAHRVFQKICCLMFSSDAKNIKDSLIEQKRKLLDLTEEAFNEFQIAGYPTWKSIACRLVEYLKYPPESKEAHNLEALKLLFWTPIDIEHIQSYNDNDLSKREEILKDWGGRINQIGNLSMLEYDINRSISNKQFQAKKLGYQKSKYYSIKEISYLDKWDQNYARKRQEEIIELIMKYLRSEGMD